MTLKNTPLIIFLFRIVIDHIEETKLVDALARADDAEPVAQLLLLEIFLCPISQPSPSAHSHISVHPFGVSTPSSAPGRDSQVFQVASRELDVGHDFDLAIAHLADLDHISEIADAAFDLDLVMEEFLEGGDVENFVRGGLGCVDDELRAFVSGTSGRMLGSGKLAEDVQRQRVVKRRSERVGELGGTYFLGDLAFAASLAFGRV